MVRILNRFHNIRNDSACGRELSGSASVEHGSAQHVALYQNAVKYIIYGIQRMILSDHDRCDPCVNLIAVHAAGSKQLHGSSKLICILEIHIGNLRDALSTDILIVYFFSGCHCCKDRDLSAGIIALYICLRIAFCIA